MEEENNHAELIPIGNGESLVPIEKLIHIIRGRQVMLDTDLASLYGVETRVLNQSVKRNQDRFPEDFMFQLTKEETIELQNLKSGADSRSQNVILNTRRGSNIKYLPYLVRAADNRIILIDNYVDDRVLRLLAKRKEGVAATIYTDPRHSNVSNDLKQHNNQYPRITIKTCYNVHDRFLIIDDTVYFIGGSIKDLGKKIVAFSRMQLNPDTILSRLRPRDCAEK